MTKRFERLDAGEFERLPDGSLRAKANLTKVGVFAYRRDDGSRVREYRPASEVFASESLASIRSVPLTWLHPKEFVNPTNWRELAIGHVSGAEPNTEGDLVTSSVVVSNAAEIAKIDSGEAGDLSGGYDCVLVTTPGVTDSGEQYDAIQTKIVYNHFALLPKGQGRLGRDVSLRTDAAELDDNDEDTKEGSSMTTHRIDGKDYTAGSPEHIAAVDAHVASLVVKLGEAEKVSAAEKKRADAAVAAADPKEIKKAADKRVALVLRATQDGVELAGKKLDEGTDDEIIMGILKKSFPGLDFAQLGLSHEQLMIMLAQTTSGGEKKPDAPTDKPAGDAPPPPNAPPRTDGIDAARGSGAASSTPTKPKTEAEAIRARAERTNNAYKGKK